MAKRLAGLFVLGIIIAFVFGPDGPLGGFWRPLPGGEEPSGAMLPAFMAVTLAEGLAMGAAAFVLLYGRSWFTRLVSSTRLATLGWLSTAYLLVSWWPHTAMHRHFGDRLGWLLAIEWIFHVGAMAGIGVLVILLAQAAKERQPVAS
ncbi:MAG: hypothetical protein ACRDT4_26270 [Micromonosporaceae bacterium]